MKTGTFSKKCSSMPAAKTTAKIPLCLSSQPMSCVPEAMNKSQFPSPEDHVWVAVVYII